MILASAADKRLSELAELADSVLAVAPPSVAALQPDIAGRAPTTALHDIREQIYPASPIPSQRCRPARNPLGSWRGDVRFQSMGAVQIKCHTRTGRLYRRSTSKGSSGFSRDPL
ncbi:hypothetical protein HPB50_010669 [Hyalomma asiaticum]|uniref:Uncharacterized protein n=1 Tax=Hyalomma asiaticum TaxID=266040 RepID=A0ACB7TIR5_HYAAI|nr:hypothetical protein HPB50_010669 [Hyalomma asiaticum]